MRAAWRARFGTVEASERNRESHSEEERTTMAMDSLHLPDPSAAPHPDSALRLASTVHRFSIVSVRLFCMFAEAE